MAIDTRRQSNNTEGSALGGDLLLQRITPELPRDLVPPPNTPTPGDDVLIGTPGNDIFKGSRGNDFIDGRDGTDTVDYSHLGAAITLKARGVVEKQPPLNQKDQTVQTDQLVSIERIIGATGKANTIDAQVDASNQTTSITVDLGLKGLTVSGIPGLNPLVFVVENFTTVRGTRNNDTIIGDDQANTLSGEGGNDFILGQGGNDLIHGGAGDDILNGGDGDDIITGGDGIDLMAGGPSGNDFLDGGDGYDYVSLGDATSGIFVDLRITTAQNTGGGGIDTYVNIENIIGSNFDDTIFGGQFGTYFQGQAGNDVLIATGGNVNYFDGGQGDDKLIGTASSEDTALYTSALAGVNVSLAVTQDTGQGVDVFFSIENLVGSGFADFLRGDNFANRLEGRDGNDRLYGLDGNDWLDGGGGSDTLTGGLGADTFVIDVQGPIDFITDFMPGKDKIVFRGLPTGSNVSDFLAGAVQDGNDVRLGLAGQPGSASVILQDFRLATLSVSDIISA